MLAIPELKEPRTSYMLSKIFGEAVGQQAGIPFTIFRPHNIYGPRMGMAHMIPEQLQKIWEAGPDTEVDVYSPDHRREQLINNLVLFFSHALIIRSQSPRFNAIGFSQKTPLAPDSAAAITIAGCNGGCVATQIISKSSLCNIF